MKQTKDEIGVKIRISNDEFWQIAAHKILRAYGTSLEDCGKALAEMGKALQEIPFDEMLAARQRLTWWGRVKQDVGDWFQCLHFRTKGRDLDDTD